MHLLKAIVLFAGMVCSTSVFADGNASASALKKLEGDWVIESLYRDNTPIGQQQPTWRLRLRGEKLTILEPADRFAERPGLGLRIALETDDGETLYSDLKKHQMAEVDAGIPNQIAILSGAGGLVGIYQFNGRDQIELAVTYLGQGVEGERAKLWRPPHDFAKRAGQHHIHAVLNRVPEKSPKSQDNVANENDAPESR